MLSLFLYKCLNHSFNLIRVNTYFFSINYLHFFSSEISPSRHIACEVCDTSVHGGYDPIYNQVYNFKRFIFQKKINGFLFN